MRAKDRLALRAPAKINLYLRVTGRRADGYHTLDTLMHKVGLFDHVDLVACDTGIHLRCPGCNLPENRDNLAYRAAELFLAAAADRLGERRGVRITLEKNIPLAAGLGGGSSDAATILLGLNDLFGCDVSAGELAALGLKLGADVPFFLNATPAARATGIGELLTPVAPLTGWHVLLVNPGFAVSTQWVYQTFALTSAGKPGNLARSQASELNGADVGCFPGMAPVPFAMENDLEQVTAARYPAVRRLKEELLADGAAYALMSGSGPTVFGLFANPQHAESCRARFMQHYQQTYLVAPLGA